MVRKKIGILQKIMGGLGKRLLWWRSEKMDLYVLALMAREAVKKYQEVLGSDIQTAINTLKVQFAESAKTFLRSFMGQLKLVISEDLNDMEFMSSVSLYAILGKNYKDYFSAVKFIAADHPMNYDGVDKFVTISKKCLMCSILPKENWDSYKECNYGEIIPHALASLMELILEFIGMDVTVEVHETKCFLRGDEYAETEMIIRQKPNE